MNLGLQGYSLGGNTDKPVEISKMDYAIAIGKKVAWLAAASLLVLTVTGGLAAFLATPVGHAMIIAVAVAIAIFAVLASADQSVREKVGDTKEQRMEAKIHKLEQELEEASAAPRAKTWGQTFSSYLPFGGSNRVVY